MCHTVWALRTLALFATVICTTVCGPSPTLVASRISPVQSEPASIESAETAGGEYAAFEPDTSADALPAMRDDRAPNIVLIMADDLGYGELGSYGQRLIETPRLDQLAREGMRFTQFYSGSPVCASSRCVLLTGKHTGHATVRGNREMGGWGPDEPEGQWPLRDEDVTVAEYLKRQGYATAAIGKWGLGGPGSTGHPCYQGFDLFYGYLCQRVAHNYYPTHLWHNHDVDILGNSYFPAHQKLDAVPTDPAVWDQFKGQVYAPDRMIDHALEFIEANQQQPFFLYFATPVPHVAIQVPEDSLAPYHGRFDDRPYLGQKSYLPHPEPRAGYAAMITRMDRDVGRILDRLDQLKIADNTIVIFTSDNGPTFNGGTDSAFFRSAGPLRGLKASLYEGGIRVPLIVRWPGHSPAAATCDWVGGTQDLLPTLLELSGAAPADEIDGLSMVPALEGRFSQQPDHKSLYWEYRHFRAVRAGNWKLHESIAPDGTIKTELFQLDQDVAEERNLAESHPEQVAWLRALAAASHQPSSIFPSPFYEADESTEARLPR